MTLTDVYFGLPHLARHAKALRGSRVEGVTSRGKALLTSFDNGLTMYSHNQLYGRWIVTRNGSMPKTNRSLRVALHTENSSALLYSASDIELLSADAVDAHPFLRKLGPDVLDENTDWRAVAQRLRQAPFAGRSLAALLLDQSCLAGLGNYLRSEILFVARLHPAERPKDLTRGELGRLARAVLTITRRAYHTGGVTLPERQAAMLRRRSKGSKRYRFAVFSRESQPCYQCGTPVRRITAASRRLYLCPTCQPEK